MSEKTNAPVKAGSRRQLTGLIAKNSIWYSLEQLFSFGAGFIASVAMARVIGPERLGYYTFVVLIFNLGAVLGTLGIPAATRKYMAETLGSDDTGAARAVFFYSLRRQTIAGLIVMAVSWVITWFFVDPAYRTITLVLVASILPNFMLAVPSQANVAAERYVANVPASVIAQIIYVTAVFLSLWLGWELLGIAIGVLVYRWVELLVRIIPVLKWVRSFPEKPLDAVLKNRIRSFANQGALVLALNLIVWNRSDVVFLKMLSRDVAQITFYSLGFNLTEKILLMGRSFASASGASMMVEYGRNIDRVYSLTARTSFYLLVAITPLLIGLSVMSPILVPLIYGRQYYPAIVPVMIVSGMALLGALYLPALQLLQTTERQKRIILWTGIGALINIGVDVLLIPRYGAIGAAAGNGFAQTVAAAGMWWEALRLFPLPMPWKSIAKVLFSVAGMAAVAASIVFSASPLAALMLAPCAGAVVYLFLLRWTRALDESDYRRLHETVPARLGRVRPYFVQLLRFVIPVQPA